MRIHRTLLFAGFVVAASSAASAQAQTLPPADANCTPTRATPQGTITPNDSATKGNEQLGDKLAKSDGVLCPPSNVDPAMRSPAPNADSSNTPVIPPPGSPGGDQSVRPK